MNISISPAGTILLSYIVRSLAYKNLVFQLRTPSRTSRVDRFFCYCSANDPSTILRLASPLAIDSNESPTKCNRP